MKQLYLFAVLLFYGPRLFGQQKTFTLSLFYNIGQEASPANDARLDSLLNTLAGDSCHVRVFGYADYLGSTESNDVLSIRRAGHIHQRLVAKKSRKVLILIGGSYGERESGDERSKLGDPYHRRVDVIVTLVPLPVKTNAVVPARKMEAPAKTQSMPPPDKQLVEQLMHLTKGQSMAIDDLSFIPGKHIWLKSSEPSLAALLQALQDYPVLKIEIQGHICCIDGPGDALDFDTGERRLSENRARAVYDYLVTFGIDAGRLTYKGYGHSQPKILIEKNSFDEQVNRRVEIKILDN